MPMQRTARTTGRRRTAKMPPLHEVPQQGREGRTLGGPKETSPEALGQLM